MTDTESNKPAARERHMGRAALGSGAVSFAACLAFAGPMPAPPVFPTPQPHIRFAGGDGSSCRGAVVIVGASHEVEGVRAERWWVFTQHPGATVVEQTVSEKNGRDLETFHIVTAAGRSRTVCFDITSFYGKP